MRRYGISGFLAVALLALLSHANPAQAACTAPDGVLGEVRYNEDNDLFQGCTARGWMGFHPVGEAAPSGPTGCDNIGDTCSDGTIYAGLSPDGNVAMYAMPTDGPLGGYAVAPIGGYPWNDGSSDWVDTEMENCTSTSSTAVSCNTGRVNTTLLAAITGGSPAPYKAAQYCEDLTSNGYSDWYLPAQNELKLLYNLYVAGKGGFVADTYWSSSESNMLYTWNQDFSSGDQNNTPKLYGYRVRCVRR